MSNLFDKKEWSNKDREIYFNNLEILRLEFNLKKRSLAKGLALQMRLERSEIRPQKEPCFLYVKNLT